MYQHTKNMSSDGTEEMGNIIYLDTNKTRITDLELGYDVHRIRAVSYTHLTLPTIYSV